jgi:prepilin-type N-terminal cleavage/methylation domain-containing protein
MKRARRNGGFTLLELLLAIGLSLLLSLLAYGGLQLGIRSWEAVDRQLQQGEQRYLSQRLLRRLLESPQLQRLRGADGQLQLAFQGRADGLIFCAQLPGQGELGRLYWLQLVQQPAELGPGPSEWQLLLRYLPFQESAPLDWLLLEETLSLDGKSELLLEGLQQPLRFAYLERPRDGEARWLDEWLEQAEMPPLLSLHGEAAAASASLALIVAPRENRHAIVPAR